MATKIYSAPIFSQTGILTTIGGYGLYRVPIDAPGPTIIRQMRWTLPVGPWDSGTTGWQQDVAVQSSLSYDPILGLGGAIIHRATMDSPEGYYQQDTGGWEGRIVMEPDDEIILNYNFISSFLTSFETQYTVSAWGYLFAS